MRAPVNGKPGELDEPPKLDKTKKHSIDVVVDRFKVPRRPSSAWPSRSRPPAEAGRRPGASPVDEGRKRNHFSAQPHSPARPAATISELEPRCSRSTTRPAPARPATAWALSSFRYQAPGQWRDDLAEGAVRGWDRRNVYYFQMLGRCPAALRGSAWKYRSTSCRRTPEVILFTAAARRTSTSSYLNDRGDIVKRRTRSKASCRTWNAATAKPSRQRARRAGQVPQHPALPGLPRHPPAPKRARLGSARKPCPVTGHADRRCLRILCLPEPDRPRGGNRRQDPQGNSRAPAVPGQRRPRLLSLDRSADTLSGGEASASAWPARSAPAWSGVMYILDEPSIGLHQRDNERLLGTLKHLRDIGNTVIVVEHDEDAIRAGRPCGRYRPGRRRAWRPIVAQGTPLKSWPTRLADRQVSCRAA